MLEGRANFVLSLESGKVTTCHLKTLIKQFPQTCRPSSQIENDEQFDRRDGSVHQLEEGGAPERLHLIYTQGSIMFKPASKGTTGW